MLNRTIATTLTLLISTLSYAQDETPKITTLAKGASAPFAGTLLNPPAVAHTIAEKENVVNQCELSKQYIEGREKTKCDLTVNSAKASLEALDVKHSSIISIKDEEIQRLNKIALERPNRYNHWWFAGGTAVGIVTSIVIFYAAVEVTK